MRQIADLAVRMARKNPRWVYTRIQGALANLGHRVGRTTVANILKRHGIEPVRLPPSSPNLNAHAERFVRLVKEKCLDRMVLRLGCCILECRERLGGLLRYSHRQAA